MKCYSASKSALETYAECEFKFYLNYICKVPSPSGKSALIGNIVHKVMEILALRKKNKKHKKKSKINDPQWLLDIVYMSYTKKNKDIEWTNVDYNTCIKNIDWLLNNGFHPFTQKVLDAEQNFELSINKKGFKNKDGDYYKIKGIIDLCVDEKNDTLHIIDYKTGKYVSDWATGKEKIDFSKDLQLRMYYLAVKKLYPKHKKYKFSVVYSNLGKVFTTEIGHESEKSIIESLRRYFVKININETPLRLKDDDTRSDLKWRCFKLCHYGKSGQCDSANNKLNQYGIDSAIKYIQPTISAKSNRAVFTNLGDYFDK